MLIDAKTLKREMGARDWHLGQLAEAAGVHRTTLSRAIKGESTHTETLDAIAGALGFHALVAFLPAEPYAGQQIRIEIPGDFKVTLVISAK